MLLQHDACSLLAADAGRSQLGDQRAVADTCIVSRWSDSEVRGVLGGGGGRRGAGTGVGVECRLLHQPLFLHLLTVAGAVGICRERERWSGGGGWGRSGENEKRSGME